MEQQLYFRLLKNGTISFPVFLLRYYKQMGLSDEEMMLIIHIMDFKNDGKDFPTIQELKNRMCADETKVILMFQKLIQNGFLSIEDLIDEPTGIRFEIIQLDPLYRRLVDILLQQQVEEQKQKEAEKVTEFQADSLFSVFEQEFGRPLSPIECETLNMWQDNDHYSDQLIIAALREAVISGKLYFRYIDRILFEWQRNNIRTPKQARDFSLKFRKPFQPQAQKKVEPFPFYNWLDSEN